MIYPLYDGIGSVELLMVAGTDQDIVDAARVSLTRLVTRTRRLIAS